MAIKMVAGVKQRETSQDQIRQASVLPPPVRVMKKAQVLWQVWHTLLRKVCTENLHIWTVIAQDLYGAILSCLELALLHYWKLCHLASL